MIVTEVFLGDDEILAWVQHDMYGRTVGILIGVLEARYHRATLQSPGLYRHLPIKAFDHRPVQSLHDALAAGFRWTLLTLPSVNRMWTRGIDGAVPEDELFDFQQEWWDFARQKLHHWCDRHPDLPRQALTALIFPNPSPAGIDAEEWIYNTVVEPYQAELSNSPPPILRRP